MLIERGLTVKEESDSEIVALGNEGARMTSTYIRHKDWLLSALSRGEYVIHREDLSDLAEPYLSAVKEARAESLKSRKS